MSRRSFDDPFDRFLRPPNETDAERTARLAGEQEAARISAEIDEALKVERAATKKRRQQEVKILLLGQSLQPLDTLHLGRLSDQCKHI